MLVSPLSRELPGTCGLGRRSKMTLHWEEGFGCRHWDFVAVGDVEHSAEHVAGDWHLRHCLDCGPVEFVDYRRLLVIGACESARMR